MGNDLTSRQKDVLDCIRNAVKTKGYPPSVREIGEAVGLSSTSTVHGHLARLEEKGFIRRDATKPRAIELTFDVGARHSAVSVPIVGKVTAGQPILAVENIEDHFVLPADLIGEDTVFMLDVMGDSMVEAGIFDGDRLVVRQQHTAQNGDIVVALLGDEATVKRFFKEESWVRLQPENSFMEPIFTKEVDILGKVIGLYRRISG